MTEYLRHIVLFKIRDGVTKYQLDEAMRLLKILGEENSSILEWTIEKSLDERKGIIIVENALFKSAEDLKDFTTSEKHIKAGELMKEISDWIIGDYIESSKQ